MAPDEQLLHAMVQQRAAATDAIVNSAHPKKLVVAGPGTGKSFTFLRALAAAVSGDDGAPGLALTFIRSLVTDLDMELRGVADVFTFHGYCKQLMHKYDVAGLRSGDYFPPLFDILIDDIRVIDGRAIRQADVEALLHNLDEKDGIVADVLARADYYNAVSHTDLVYRVLQHFDAFPDSVPSYPLIVVDEYQDFSLLETMFIGLLARKSPVLVAGDDDQALYSFKQASPRFIRELAAGDEYLRFKLPYCSRCTEVIVAAVNDIIATATARGNLGGRLQKEFTCYLPEKQADSATHKKIIHVKCSTANTSYLGSYIAQQIARIPEKDVATSRSMGYPTVLVIGPKPFLGLAFEVVRRRFPQARMKTRPKVEIDLLDGYERITVSDRSRLGWRIVIACRPFAGSDEILKDVLESDAELLDRLPDPYVREHREIARLVGLLLEDGQLSDEDGEKLCAAVERPLDQIKACLKRRSSGEVPADDESVAEDCAHADILFTSLVGSKGLSAEHVFIVGLNDGHFPRDAGAITDDEICSLLVALSRTRKRCHVISCGFLGNGFLCESVFLGWIRRHVDPITVNKHYNFAD